MSEHLRKLQSGGALRTGPLGTPPSPRKSYAVDEVLYSLSAWSRSHSMDAGRQNRVRNP